VTEDPNPPQDSPLAGLKDLVADPLAGSTERFAKLVDEKGASAFIMGFGATLVAVDLLSKVDLGGYRLAHLRMSEFITLVASGVALLLMGATMRLYQYHMALRGQEAKINLLEKAAEVYKEAASTAGSQPETGQTKIL
jgi:hypothetical protein